MNPAKLLCASVLSLLLLVPTATGQSVDNKVLAQHDQLRPAVDKELERQALALLDESIQETQSLKLPENRIRLQATSAELLWPRDKVRARELFATAMNNLSAMMQSIASDDPQYYNRISTPAQLRQQLLQVIARRDPQLALDFLHATHQPPPPEQPSAYNRQPDPDAALELSLAEQTAAADPQQALRLAEEALPRGLSGGLTGVLEQLRRQSPAAADKLAGEIIQKLRATDFLREGEAANVASYLLQTTRVVEPASNGRQIVNLAAPRQLHIDEQTRRDLVSAMTKALLSATPAQRQTGALYGLSSTLQQALPEVERYAPAQAATLKRRLTEYEQAMNPQAALWRQYQPLMQNGPVDALLEAAASAPPDMRAQLYQSAAQRAFNEGGSERARDIIRAHIENRQQREQMLHGLEQQSLWQAAQRGDVAQALRLLERIKPLNERVNALLNLARTLASKEQPQPARQLLDEAANLLSGQPRNAEQFSLQLQLAQAYVPLAPARAFELVEARIDHLNELMTAAAVVDGFGQEQFEQDELRGQGGYIWRSLIEQTGSTLTMLARVDFARARADADRFQRPEARLPARLAIVQAILAEGLPLNGRGRNIISFSGGRSGGFVQVVPD